MSSTTGKQSTENHPYKQRYKKDRFKYVKMELIKLDTPYAFTLNVNDKIIKNIFLEDYNIYKKCLDHLYSGIQGLELQCFPEYSQAGRFHVHGVLIFRNVIAVARFYAGIPHLNQKGNVKVDTISDVDVWKIYLLKQKHIMAPMCKLHNVSYMMDIGAKQIKEVKPSEDQNNIEEVFLKKTKSISSKRMRGPRRSSTDANLR